MNLGRLLVPIPWSNTRALGTVEIMGVRGSRIGDPHYMDCADVALIGELSDLHCGSGRIVPTLPF